MAFSSNLFYTVLAGILTVQLTVSFQFSPFPDELDTLANWLDNCTRPDNCNNTAVPYLVCDYSWGSDPDSGRCRCQGELDGQMDYQSGKCKFTIGNDCPVGEEDPCILHADCNDGTCECIDGFYGGEQNSTICWTSWNSTCSLDNDLYLICYPSDGLYCNNITNVCECEEADREWSDKFNHCVSATRHGDPCEPTSEAEDCAQDLNPFMECDADHRCACRGEADLDMRFIYNQCLATRGKTCEDGQACIYNSHCQGDLCTCDTGYSDGPINFLCAASWGTPCTTAGNNYTVGICDSTRGLRCEEDTNVCKCYDDGNYREWRDETCSPLIGSSCEKDVDTCPPAADCINKWTFTTCECNQGYSQTKENHCKLGRGSTCLANPDPAHPELECNDGLLLTCTDGRCACNANSLIDDYGQCRVHVGSPCDYEKYGDLDRLCVFRSECVREDNSTTVGVCVCMDGMTPSDDRTTCGGTFLSGSLLVILAGVVLKSLAF